MLKRIEINKMVKGILPETNGNAVDYISKIDYDNVLKNISTNLYNQTEIANELEFKFRESINALKYKTAEIVKKFGTLPDGKSLSVECQNEICLQTDVLRKASIEVEKEWRKELNEKRRLELLYYSTKESAYRELAYAKGILKR